MWPCPEGTDVGAGNVEGRSHQTSQLSVREAPLAQDTKGIPILQKRKLRPVWLSAALAQLVESHSLSLGAAERKGFQP